MDEASPFLVALGPPSARAGAGCTVARALRRLPDADAAGLRMALADEDAFTSRQIAAALVVCGERVKHQTVARHRRRDCQCAP